jgi:hypothetical protein
MANKPLRSIKFPNLPDTYTVPEVDATLTTQGAAADAKAVGDALSDLSVETDKTLSVEDKPADAKKVGDEISDIKADLSDMNTATSSDVGKALIVRAVVNGKVASWKFGKSGGGLSNAQKNAILNCFAHVAWTDNQGQTYYDELEDVLFPPAELELITATYTNTNPVYPDSTLDSLRPYIVVTAHCSDGTTSTVNAYTLTGTLTIGTSIVEIEYEDLTTTISVTVTEKPKSDMNGWNDGVMYTDITTATGYYTGTGSIGQYSTWYRTEKIPCDGASKIVFEPYGTGSGGIDRTYCWFFDENKDPLSQFQTSMPEYLGGEQTVPSNAFYFGISGTAAYMDGILENGFTPYA